MLALIAIRAGQKGPKTASEGFVPARIGLLRAAPDAVFDPAFAVFSPSELVLAPTAAHFDFPVGSQHGALTRRGRVFEENGHPGEDFHGIGGPDSAVGDPVFAVADGKVLYAGSPSPPRGNVVMLLHETAEGEMVESVYERLGTIRVPVGGQVRRGEILGTIASSDSAEPGDSGHLHFELRRVPCLDPGSGDGGSARGRLAGESTLTDWRHRRDDQLAAPPAGEPLDPPALRLDVEETVR